jgi:hypothetical protein
MPVSEPKRTNKFVINRKAIGMKKVSFKYLNHILEYYQIHYSTAANQWPGKLVMYSEIHYTTNTVEAAEGRTTHNNGRNRANGIASNTWKPCV